MHIDKNIFEFVVGAILRFEWKTFVGFSIWYRPLYTLSAKDKITILDRLNDVKYPSGFTDSLASKINVHDKKVIGLKMHDCSVMLECLIQVFIRPFLPQFIVNLIGLKNFLS